jgi:molybdopterin-guanine dinucleotide biosynthesis protein A
VPVAGVVVAGGAGRRMGGVDKAALQVGGIALLDRVLAAARPVCDRLVVVGPTRPTGVTGVEFVTEAVPGGGPVPAVLAGLDACPGCDVVVVLAADLPLLTERHLRRLLGALESSGADAACAAGRDGSPNPLLGAYRAAVLRATSAGLGPGTPARRLVPPSAVVEDLGRASLNVNRPEDLTAAQVVLAAGEDDGVLRPTSD